MLDMNGIEFEEQYNNSVYKTATIYYTAPLKLLDEFDLDYNPTDEGCTISLEFPVKFVDTNHCLGVEISPCDDGCDYEWTDIDLEDSDIENLLNLVSKEYREATIFWNE